MGHLSGVRMNYPGAETESSIHVAQSGAAARILVVGFFMLCSSWIEYLKIQSDAGWA